MSKTLQCHDHQPSLPTHPDCHVCHTQKDRKEVPRWVCFRCPRAIRCPSWPQGSCRAAVTKCLLSAEGTLPSRMLTAAQQSRARSKNIAPGEGGVQVFHVSILQPRGLSLLSQVKFWKPQPLITAWHRAPSGFRVACVDSSSLHRTWVWAKFKHRHRQFNSFLWGGNLMVNHNYRYN